MPSQVSVASTLNGRLPVSVSCSTATSVKIASSSAVLSDISPSPQAVSAAAAVQHRGATFSSGVCGSDGVIRLGRPLAVPLRGPPPAYAATSARKKRNVFELKDLKIREYFDLTAQIVGTFACVEANRRIVRVWDGTKLPHQVTNISDIVGNVKKGAYIPSLLDFLEQRPGLFADIFVYDEHVSLCDNLKPGDVVQFRNLHSNRPKDAPPHLYPETIVMHTGGAKWDRGLTRLESSDPVSVALIRRLLNVYPSLEPRNLRGFINYFAPAQFREAEHVAAPAGAQAAMTSSFAVAPALLSASHLPRGGPSAGANADAGLASHLHHGGPSVCADAVVGSRPSPERQNVGENQTNTAMGRVASAASAVRPILPQQSDAKVLPAAAEESVAPEDSSGIEDYSDLCDVRSLSRASSIYGSDCELDIRLSLIDESSDDSQVVLAETAAAAFRSAVAAKPRKQSPFRKSSDGAAGAHKQPPAAVPLRVRTAPIRRNGAAAVHEEPSASAFRSAVAAKPHKPSPFPKSSNGAAAGHEEEPSAAASRPAVAGKPPPIPRISSDRAVIACGAEEKVASLGKRRSNYDETRKKVKTMLERIYGEADLFR